MSGGTILRYARNEVVVGDPAEAEAGVTPGRGSGVPWRDPCLLPRR